MPSLREGCTIGLAYGLPETLPERSRKPRRTKGLEKREQNPQFSSYNGLTPMMDCGVMGALSPGGAAVSRPGGISPWNPTDIPPHVPSPEGVTVEPLSYQELA
jgi:hypothetical protein